MSLERELRRRQLRTITKDPIAWDPRRRQYVWLGGIHQKVKATLLERERAKAAGEIPEDMPMFFTASKPEPESAFSSARRSGSPASDSSSPGSSAP